MKNKKLKGRDMIMDITKEYSRAYVEVLEVLKFLKEEEYNRIPKERINIYNNYKDNEYYFKIDERKKIGEQISPKAKAVLSNLFVRYIANDDDREEIIVQERKREYQEEMVKYQNIKLNPLFERREKLTKTIEENQSLIVYEKDNIFKKFIKKIKAFLKKRRRK